jgi:hypothetical protein
VTTLLAADALTRTSTGEVVLFWVFGVVSHPLGGPDDRQQPGGENMIRTLLAAAAIGAVTIGAAAASADPTLGAAAGITGLAASPVISAGDQCGDGYEWSTTAGSCIPVPTQAPTPPPGATYQCVDGTYSFSPTSTGACSRHGGIDHPV